MSYRKVGGLHFVTFLGFGFTFYRRRRAQSSAPVRPL
jgi:hypothetical protein